MFNNRTNRFAMLLALLVIMILSAVSTVGAQDVAPVYIANDQALCDFTFSYASLGGDWKVERYIQDNADGIVLEVTDDGWGEVTSDKMFTVFVGDWDAATKSLINPDGGTLAVQEEGRFAYRLDEARTLAVGKALLVTANCLNNVDDATLPVLPVDDPNVCNPSFARMGEGLGRKIVDGSRILHFAAAEVNDATLVSDTPFVVFTGMIDGNADIVSPQGDYSFSDDGGMTYKYVITTANPLPMNYGLLVAWPCSTGAADNDFMSHITSEPNVDWCNARVIPAGATETVAAGCVVSGDVVVDGQALYDNSEFTGVVVLIEGEAAQVHAQWGASVWPAGTVLQTAHDALMLTGCGSSCVSVGDFTK